MKLIHEYIILLSISKHGEDTMLTLLSLLFGTENKSEEAMERMREVADDLVAKLMEEEEGPLRDEMMHRHLPHLSGHVREPEKWFYRDPQGQVQGML
jgi:hypothetical protein